MSYSIWPFWFGCWFQIIALMLASRSGWTYDTTFWECRLTWLAAVLLLFAGWGLFLYGANAGASTP